MSLFLKYSDLELECSSIRFVGVRYREVPTIQKALLMIHIRPKAVLTASVLSAKRKVKVAAEVLSL